MRGGNPGPTSARFSKARSPQTCRSCSRRSSSWSLTSRPPGCLASPCHRHCWSLPTRLSNDREDEAARVHHAARRRGSGVAAGGPRAARAQQPGVPVVGFLSSLSASVTGKRVVSFGQGLTETGYVVGRDVMVEQRLADGQYDRLPALAADLVNRRVNLIAALAPPAAF